MVDYLFSASVLECRLLRTSEFVAMAQIMRCRFGFRLFGFDNNRVTRPLVSPKFRRSWLHTTCIVNVKGREVLMPSLSPTMETGTIVKWMKKEGDAIQPGDALADIQTDKAVMTFEMDDEAVLAKIIVPEGQKDIKVGTLIALTVESGEDWKQVEMPSGSASPAEPAPVAAAAAPSPVSSQEMPPGQVNVTMPALSPTMTSGVIVKWLKKEGDEIAPGDALADIQTDKAVMTFEVDDEAILAKIIMQEGSSVEVGQLIAITMEKGSDWKTAVVPTAGAPAPPKAAEAAAPAAAPAGHAPPPSGQAYGLAVKRLLEEYGLSSGSVKGTGRGNRLLKEDVLAHIKSNNVQKVDLSKVSVPAPGDAASAKPKAPSKTGPGTYTDITVSNIRAVIAKRLGESKTNIPHSYAAIDINVDKLIETRKKLKADGISVSINDFVIKAVASALVECPDVNTLYKDGQVIRVPNVDISVAVSTPNGLITPIVFNSSSRSLSDISSDFRALAGKARDGTLQPNEFQGGSFTISNLGMLGIREFSAIINPPQTAILAVGTGREVLDSNLRKSTRMTVTLSYDNRAIDEDQAATFLSVVRAILEEPTFLAVSRTRDLIQRSEMA